MSLATRCPACGTIFRVVQDQLKVSEGWVRCGQCHEVFHGIESLFDLDSDAALAARRAARGAGTSSPPRTVFTPAPSPMAGGDDPDSAGTGGIVVPPAPAPAPSAPGPRGVPTPIVAPAPRPTIAPRFAARLAEESARWEAARKVTAETEMQGLLPAVGRAAEQPASLPSAHEVLAPPSLADLPGPAPVLTPSPALPPPVAPAAPHLEAEALPDPFFQPTLPFPEPSPPGASEALAEPVLADEPELELPPLPEIPKGVATVVDEAPLPEIDPTRPAPLAPPEIDPTQPMPLALPEIDPTQPMPLTLPEPAAPARQPRTLAARAAEAEPEFELPPHAQRIVVDDAFFAPPPPAPARPGVAPAAPFVDDEDDDEDQGPLTLASMLPDASGWPERPEPRSRARRRDRRPPAASSAAAASALASTRGCERETARSEAETQLGEAAAAQAHDARFLREAHREARWRRPWVRAVLGIALVALAVGAGAQLAWPLRDELAARYPATRPAWDALCAQLGCTIEAPRALASLSLDGSSLTRTGTEHVLLFSADLHNRAGHDIRMPSFELTFTDLNGEIVAREVLTPEQVGIRQHALAPQAELHVHARLQVGTPAASGFQADLFYP